MIHPVLANLSDVRIVLPIAAFLFAATMALAGMYFQNKKREMWHHTARIALEKGQPLPPMPSYRGNQHRHAVPERQDFRAGLILVGVGTGLWFFFGAIADQMRYVGLIPGLIGVALLLNGILTAIFAKDKPTSDDHSPQP